MKKRTHAIGVEGEDNAWCQKPTSASVFGANTSLQVAEELLISFSAFV